MNRAHTYFLRRHPHAYRHAHPYFHRRHPPQPAPPPSQPFPPAPSGTWTVPTLWERYGLPTNLDGNGVIGIFEAGGGWVTRDVVDNFGMMGLEIPTITDVSVDGTENNMDPNDPASTEVMLDIVAAAGSYAKATGRAATIRIYWSQSFSEAIAAASKDGCRVMSFSWGADESTWGTPSLPETLDDVENAAIAATEAGMTIFAASGDSDADDGSGVAGVDAPASCPHIIGCGGTHLTETAESCWNDTPGDASGEGSGGGFSAHFPVQSWQVGAPTPPDGRGRMVPDAAAVADPETGIYMIVGGQAGVVGGTSFVAPFYAGIWAGASAKPLGFFTSTLWANPGYFNPDLYGNNGPLPYQTQPPVPGPVTGLGSPKGSLLTFLSSK